MPFGLVIGVLLASGGMLRFAHGEAELAEVRVGFHGTFTRIVLKTSTASPEPILLRYSERTFQIELPETELAVHRTHLEPESGVQRLDLVKRAAGTMLQAKLLFSVGRVDCYRLSEPSRVVIDLYRDDEISATDGSGRLSRSLEDRQLEAEGAEPQPGTESLAGWASWWGDRGISGSAPKIIMVALMVQASAVVLLLLMFLQQRRHPVSVVHRTTPKQPARSPLDREIQSSLRRMEELRRP